MPKPKTMAQRRIDANSKRPKYCKWWSSSSGRIEIVIDLDDVETVCHSGPNDEPVKHVRRKSYIKSQFDKYPMDTLKAEIAEIVESESVPQHTRRRCDALDFLVWVACWAIFDDICTGD